MRRGEVWLARDESTPEKDRGVAVVIVGNDALNLLPLRLVIPLVDWKDEYEQAGWMTAVVAGSENGPAVVQAADALRVCSIPMDRLLRPLGVLTGEEMDGLAQGLRTVFDIE